jgi:hypothetical protein
MTMALSYADDDDVGFGASAEMTALLFLTPAAVAQLISAPLIGRLAVLIGGLRDGVARGIDRRRADRRAPCDLCIRPQRSSWSYSSLGFAWAGPIVGQGTVAGFHSAMWISVGIGVVALGMSLVLKPRLSH